MKDTIKINQWESYKKCKQCKQYFYPLPYEQRRGRVAFCSKDCASRYANIAWLHQELCKLKGKPKKCEICGTNDPLKRYEWANLTGNYSDFNDYKRMCRSCHFYYDKIYLNARQYPVRFTKITHRKNLKKEASSNVVGVYFLKRKKIDKWKAAITINKIIYSLGNFENYDEAICHRLAAEQCLYGDFERSTAYQYVRKNIQRFF